MAYSLNGGMETAMTPELTLQRQCIPECIDAFC